MRISHAPFSRPDLDLAMQPSILLLNPNSNAQTTDAMVEIAGEASKGCKIDGVTMTGVPPIITTPEALDQAADAVSRTRVDNGHSAVIVAAFGDPGLDELRGRLSVPVVGIAEASLLEAGQNGRLFSVATTTPALGLRISERAAQLGLARECVSVRFTKGDPFVVMADTDRLAAALATTIDQCIQDGALAVVIGGGPLAKAARVLKLHFDVPIIEPIVSAVALAEKRIEEAA